MTARVVVVGDAMVDHYYFGESMRLCPEAPVPIVRWKGPPQARHGGAALVAAQLKEILGVDNVLEAYGSWSHKYRYYADNHMMLRADRDSVSLPTEYFESQVELLLNQPRVEAVVISDYAKGGLNDALAQKIIAAGKKVFVDAKLAWEWYKGAFCAFPNRYEGLSGTTLERRDWFSHVVRKNQHHGCLVDGEPISAYRMGEMRDSTGAGDVFIASFVAWFLKTSDLKASAKFANMVAGISVKHIGTHVVRREEMPGENKPTEPVKKKDARSSDAIAAQAGDDGVIN